MTINNHENIERKDWKKGKIYLKEILGRSILLKRENCSCTRFKLILGYSVNPYD